MRKNMRKGNNNPKITVDPKIHFGKPVVAGTRIPVYTVLELVETGIPFGEITKKYYPDLTIKDIQACIQYALNLIKFEDIHLGSLASII